ncbi:hypothetical protein [Pseudoflavonifractor sp. An44]|nr:hypothetical protein [Pseudoflavonifractor sp. An44]
MADAKGPAFFIFHSSLIIQKIQGAVEKLPQRLENLLKVFT